MPEFKEYVPALPDLPAGADAKFSGKVPVILDGVAYQVDIRRLLNAVTPGEVIDPNTDIQVVTAPKFAPDGALVKVGVPVGRISGVYVNGIATAGARYRGTGSSEIAIAGATGVSYTPTTADIGAMLVFKETVTSSSGQTLIAESAPVGPVLPASSTGAASQVFDFLNSTPTGVTVARSGTLATRRSGAATIAVMAANTLRYQHDAAGNKLGLLCEKARTNLFTNAVDMGAAMSVTGTATKTSNYGTAPNGSTQSTRLQVSAGNTGGLLLGVLGVSSARRIFLAVKGTAGQEFIISDENTGEYSWYTTVGGWQILELDGTAGLASSYYGFRVLNSNAAALDIELWGAGVQLGTGVQTLVATTGTSAARPKEVLTFTLDTGSVTRDVLVVDNTGASQNFASQVIGGGATWTLDADSLTIGPIIRSVGFYPQGEAGSAPPTGGKAFGNTAIVGDSLMRGDAPNFYSPVEHFKLLMQAAGHTLTFVGTGGRTSSPGGIPVASNGGWKVDDAIADLPALLATNPVTVFVALGTNGVADTVAKLRGYLNSLASGMGGLNGKRVIVAAPYELGWFDDADAEALRAVIAQWCVEGTGRTYIDLRTAGTLTITGDGTHWTEADAQKIAAYMKTGFDIAPVGTAEATPSNSIDVAVSDMTGSVDLFPWGLNPNAAWSKGGVTSMGRGFSGAATPSYWSGGNTAPYKSDTTWYGMENWWYINRSQEGKASNNARIQVRRVRSFIQLESTKEWIMLINTDSPGAEFYPASGSGAPTGSVPWRAATSGGGREFKFDSNTGNKNIHGYGGRANIEQYLGNIRNVFCQIEARVVLDNQNGTDDLDEAKYLAVCGCDAYPDMGTRVRDFGSVEYNPGMGCGRFKLITRDWQLFTFTPLANSKEVDSSSSMSVANKTISEANFRLYPPPFSL